MTTSNHRLSDIHPNAAEFAHLRALDPEMPDHIWRIILAYTPKMPASQWAAVREFTLATAMTMRPDSFDEARRLMTTAGRFHTWLWATTGTELTAQKVYQQHHIDLYVQERMHARSASHRWSVVRQLVAIGHALTEATLRNLPAPKPSEQAPFAPAQIATMNSWASALHTPKQRQNAWGLLSLACGAGLRAEEIVEVTVADVQTHDDRVFVSVPGRRARRVPLRRPWARVLTRAIDGRAATERIFRGPHIEEYRPRIIQSFLTDHPAPVRPTVSRLRATWIVHQLNGGVPFQVLRTAGGFRSDAGLARYLKHARPFAVEDYTALLIGEESGR